MHDEGLEPSPPKGLVSKTSASTIPPIVHVQTKMLLTRKAFGASGMYRPYVLGVSIPCSTIELLKHGGCGKIRTYEAEATGLQPAPFDHLGTHPNGLYRKP